MQGVHESVAAQGVGRPFESRTPRRVGTHEKRTCDTDRDSLLQPGWLGRFIAACFEILPALRLLNGGGSNRLGLESNSHACPVCVGFSTCGLPASGYQA